MVEKLVLQLNSAGFLNSPLALLGIVFVKQNVNDSVDYEEKQVNPVLNLEGGSFFLTKEVQIGSVVSIGKRGREGQSNAHHFPHLEEEACR